MNALKIGIAGAGRMGQAILRAADDQADLEVVAVWVRNEQDATALAESGNLLVTEDLDQVVESSDVIIDFSLPEGTARVVEASARQKKPLVCGVSGLPEAEINALNEAATKIPVVYDRNMSLGIAVLERAVRDAAASLGPEFDVKIAETHHVHKKDAPSGTALKLGEAVAEMRGESNIDGIHFEVERRGDVPGDHEVVMSSPSESVTFAHSVTTRQVFADGAIRAARWVVAQRPGRYLMRDVLFGQKNAH